MKSKYLILLLSIGCFTAFTVNAQNYNNSNRSYTNKVNIKKATPNKKVNVRTNTRNTYGSRHVNTHSNKHSSHNHVNTHSNQHSSHNSSVEVIKRPNRNNIIRNKPNRPVYIKRPTLDRRGYFWINGYWKWNLYTYVWMEGFWERDRANFHWHEGSWEVTSNGFFWIEGYWCDLLWE